MIGAMSRTVLLLLLLLVLLPHNGDRLRQLLRMQKHQTVLVLKSVST